jgi:hypothetical protein
MRTQVTDERKGVRFPRTGDTRSSSRTGADIVADSLRRVAPELAEAAQTAERWRKRYVGFFAGSTRLSVRAEAAVSLAEYGLRSAWDRLVVVDDAGTEQPVSAWRGSDAGISDGGRLRTRVVHGQGKRVGRLEVPYRGSVLHGASLQRQLADWVARGTVEPGFATAVQHVIDRPELLALPGHRVVLIGAGAAMGPLTQLCQWGAGVVAIDVPVPGVWEGISRLAATGAGSVTLPIDAATGTPGLNVSSDLAAARGWLTEHWRADEIPVLATHAYADGAAHVEINLAADVLVADLVETRADAVLGYLNTPTDAFLAPADAVAEARRRARQTRWNGPAHRAASLASGGRLFQPAYAEDLLDDAGSAWGLSDTLVDVQGPNYALAKRIQRWRAVVQQHAGGRVSSTVAPASWTRSVTKNRILASVYAGVAPFGVEIFQPETARALMAAKLVADVFRSVPAQDAHPESVFIDAAHGGLWRQPFEPRSGLGVAALVGAPRTFLGRGR